MHIEWNSGLNNQIRSPILDELGDVINQNGPGTKVDLRCFNEPPLQASKSGILQVVNDAKCLKVEKERTEYGMVYEAAISDEVRRRMVKMSFFGAIKSVCGTSRDPQKACSHLFIEGGCPLRRTLEEAEKEDNQLLIRNSNKFHPSEDLFAAYLEGNMLIPQQVWGILAYSGSIILNHIGEFSFRNLNKSTFSEKQLQRVGQMMSFAHQQMNINTTVKGYPGEKGYPIENKNVPSTEFNNLWQSILTTVICQCQHMLLDAQFIQGDKANIYSEKTKGELRELDALNKYNLKITLKPLHDLYIFSRNFLEGFEGKKLSKIYRSGFMRTGTDDAGDFFELTRKGKKEAFEAYREYVDVCFNYGLEVLDIPESLLRNLFQVNRVEPRIFDSERPSISMVEVVTTHGQVDELEEFYAGEYKAYERGEDKGMLSYYTGHVAPTGEFIDRLEMKGTVVCLRSGQGFVEGSYLE